MKKIEWAVRGLVVAARDMFIGLIIGLSGTVLLAKLNPDAHRVVALLIPVGVITGFIKGLAKFLLLNVSSALPSKGYRFNYPKYKMLILWTAVLLASFFYSYGTDVGTWVGDPLRLLRENVIFDFAKAEVWFVSLAGVILAGLASHFYEPPYNEDEFLPPEAPEELVEELDEASRIESQ